MYATKIGTTTVHVIGRCPEKGCKNRRRFTAVDAPIRRSSLYTWTDWRIPAAAPYDAVHAQLNKGSAVHYSYAPRPSRYLSANRHAYDAVWLAAVDAVGWICRDHDRFMIVVEVKGIVNESKPCTPACQGATGPNCECVCGGEGHGARWAP